MNAMWTHVVLGVLVTAKQRWRAEIAEDFVEQTVDIAVQLRIHVIAAKHAWSLTAPRDQITYSWLSSALGLLPFLTQLFPLPARQLARIEEGASH